MTRNPHALWIVQQLREAWPYTHVHQCLLLDRDAKFGDDVASSAKEMGSEPVRTAFRSLWQNGVAERWVGSCRRDLLDHVITLNGRHLKRLMSEYARYYLEDRTHLGLAKDTPAGRPTATGSAIESEIRSFPRLGGLHHRDAVAAYACLPDFCSSANLRRLVGLLGGIDHEQNQESHRNPGLTISSRDVCLGAEGFEEPQRSRPCLEIPLHSLFGLAYSR